MAKFCINIYPSYKTTVQHKFSNTLNLTKADWNGMLDFLNTHDFTSYFEMCDIESLWSYLKQIIFEAIHLLTPRVSSRFYERPKWFTSDLRHKLNCIHSLRRKQNKKPSANLKTKLANKAVETSASTQFLTIMQAISRLHSIVLAKHLIS